MLGRVGRLAQTFSAAQVGRLGPVSGQAAPLDTASSCSSVFQCASQQVVRREASSLTTTSNTESVTAVTKSLLLDTLNLVSTTGYT